MGEPLGQGHRWPARLWPPHREGPRDLNSILKVVCILKLLIKHALKCAVSTVWCVDLPAH